MPISTIALTQLIDTDGTFPSADRGRAPRPTCWSWSIRWPVPIRPSAPPIVPGSSIRSAQNQALFAMLGPTFGGNGETNFALPDLRDRIAVGGKPGMMTGQSLAMTWMIAADGVAGQPAPYPMTGAIGLFAGNAPPPGWLAADGSLLPISQQVPLFEAIGATFGGNGEIDLRLARSAGPSGGRRRPGRRRRRSPSARWSRRVPTRRSPASASTTSSTSAARWRRTRATAAFPTSASVLGEVIAYRRGVDPQRLGAGRGPGDARSPATRPCSR